MWKMSALLGPSQVWCSAQHDLGWRLGNWGNQVRNACGSQMRGLSWCSTQGGGGEGQGEGHCLLVSQPRLLPPEKNEWP